MEVSVFPLGFPVNTSKQYPDLKADISILRKHIKPHLQVTRKLEKTSAIPDESNGAT